jgi:AcrR family transcriptional regulator
LVNGRAGGRRDTAAAIFRAAAEEFAARGYDAAGVDRIAAKARVNKAMLYYHYGSKHGLYHEILRDMFRAVRVRARAIADGPGTPHEKLDTWIATIVEEAAERPWFPPIVLRELAGCAPHLDPETFAMMNGIYIAVRDLIVQGQAEGVFREADPVLIHFTIMHAVLFFFVRQRVVGRRKNTKGFEAAAPRDIDAFVRHMQAAARGMLRKDT